MIGGFVVAREKGGKRGTKRGNSSLLFSWLEMIVKRERM